MEKKRTSIAKKLQCVMLPLISILFAIIIVFNYLSTMKIMTHSIKKQLQIESDKNVMVIENWRTGLLKSLESIKGTLETVDFESDEAELKFLEKTLEFNKSIPYGVYEGDADGTYLDGSGWVPDADYVITERDWYKDGLHNSQFTFGTPYIDANTGSFVVSATTLLNRTSKNQMVAAADILLDDITREITSIHVMDSESGYAFLVDSSTNIILAHKDASQNAVILSEQDSNPFMAKISTLTTTSEYRIYEIKNNNIPYYVTINPIEDTSWVLISCVSINELFTSLHFMQAIYIVLAIIVIIISGLVIGRIIRKTTSPIYTLTENIISIGNGDFTIAVDPKGDDEVATMSYVLRDYISNMSRVIGNIREISVQLDKKSEIGTKTSKTLNSTAKQQANSMKDMKSTIEQLANAVTEIAENATTLAQVVDTTNMHVSDANEKMQDSVSMANEGYLNMQTVQTNMKNVVTSMNELAIVVDNVGNATNEVNGIIQMIGEIASETNLLALNASIESARAGEAGRGFSVVASEIGKLADSSSQSVQKITDIIKKINEQVNNMTEKAKDNVKVIDDNSELINIAYDKFYSIYNDIQNTNNIMSSIMKEVDQVNDVASNMAAISEEQSASAEVISETIENLFVQSEQVAEESSQVDETSEVLAKVAQQLNEHMKKFKIR